MNYLLVVLMVTGSLLLGPVIGTDEYPWAEPPGNGGAGHAQYDSSGPWIENPGHAGGGHSAFESSYGGSEGSVKGKPAE